MILTEVYKTLEANGMVTSKTNFSEEWLGMDGSFFRGEPRQSINALGYCINKLRRYSKILSETNGPEAIPGLAAKLSNLSDRCLEELLDLADKGEIS